MSHKRLSNTVLCASLLLFSSCAIAAPGLRSERDIPQLVTLLDRHARMQKRAWTATSTLDGQAPIRIAVEDIGSGTADRLIVLVHGLLSDRQSWRYVVGALGTDVDVCAIDLPGSGDSDCPDGDSLGPDGYSPTWFARHVMKTVRTELSDRSEAPSVTLVGHSLGGAIVLRALSDPELRSEFADVLAHVDGAVLFSPFDVGHGKADPVFVQIARVTDLEMLIGMLLGIVQDSLARSFRDGCDDPDTVPREEYERFRHAVTSPEHRQAAQCSILRAAPFDDDARPLWEEMERLVAQYQNVDVPCLLVWGARDDVLPVASGHRLRDHLPNARLRILSRCKHGLPIESPYRCSLMIREFIETGLEGRAAVEQVALQEEDLFEDWQMVVRDASAAAVAE